MSSHGWAGEYTGDRRSCNNRLDMIQMSPAQSMFAEWEMVQGLTGPAARLVQPELLPAITREVSSFWSISEDER